MKSTLTAVLAGAFLFGGGCALPLPAGPITAVEPGVLHNETEFRAVELEHRPDGETLSLIAHDGVRVSPQTPEEEAFLLMPFDRRVQMIERLSDESMRRDRRIYHVW